MPTPAIDDQSADTTRKSLPAWIPIIVIALVGIGGSYALWSFYRGLQTAGSGAAISVDEKPSEYRGPAGSERAAYMQRKRQEENRQRREEEAKGPDFFHARPNQNGIEVKGGQTRLALSRGNANSIRVTLDPIDPNAISEDDRNILQMRNRVAVEDAVARQMELTPEQRNDIKAVPGNLGYPIDGPTRKQFDGLLATWEKAQGDQKKAAEDAILAAVRDFDAKNNPGFKANLAERIEKIKAILKPEQIKKYTDMGR